MKKILLPLLLVALFASCSPTKRLDRLIKRHPELTATDTIYKIQPHYLPGVETERIVKVPEKTTDTLTIQKDRLKIEIRRIKGDTLWIKGECKGDTIYIKVPEIHTRYLDTHRTLMQKAWESKWLLLIIALLWSALIITYKSKTPK